MGVSKAWRWGSRFAALVVGTLGCTAAPNDETACAESALYNAADQGALVGLSAAQRLAIGRVVSEGAPSGSFCTGVLVNADWVVTAGHCNAGGSMTFAVGTETDHLVVSSVQVTAHASADLVAFRVDHPEMLSARGAIPLPVFDEPIDEAWSGNLVEIAGLGLDETGENGHLQFLVEPVSSVEDEAIVVDGRGVSGACLGDSGGPMLVRGGDGSVRVAAILSAGSESCLGIDRYVRLDAAKGWLAAAGVAIEPPQPTPCGDVTTEGTCQQGRAIWCNAGRMQVDACSTPCGWSSVEQGYRCVASGEDPCHGVDRLGDCVGAFAFHCIDGLLSQAKCGCGACVRQGGSGLVGCE